MQDMDHHPPPTSPPTHHKLCLPISLQLGVMLGLGSLLYLPLVLKTSLKASLPSPEVPAAAECGEVRAAGGPQGAYRSDSGGGLADDHPWTAWPRRLEGQQ